MRESPAMHIETDTCTVRPRGTPSVVSQPAGTMRSTRYPEPILRSVKSSGGFSAGAGAEVETEAAASRVATGWQIRENHR